MLLLVLPLSVVPSHGQPSGGLQIRDTALEQMARLFMDGKNDSALAVGQSLLPLAEAQSDTMAQLNICLVCGLALRELKQERKALDMFSRGVALCQPLATTVSVGRRQLTANLLINLANVCYDLKRRKDCARYARRAARVAMTVPQSDLHAMVLPYAGRLLLFTGSRKEAVGLLTKGLEASRHTNQPDQQLLCTALLALAEDEEHHTFPADNKWLHEAELLSGKASDPFCIGTYNHVAGKLHMRSGNLTEAAESFARIDSVGALSHVSKEELQHIYHRVKADEALRDSLATAYTTEVPSLVSGYRRQTVVAAVLLALLLLVFAAYALWQHRRRRRQQEQSQAMARTQYMEGLEHERQRLARELHDGVANDLLALQMKLSSEGLTESSLSQLKASREQVRVMSHELLPPEFAQVTLAEAVGSYAATWNANEGAIAPGEGAPSRVELMLMPEDADWSAIPPSTALEVYRIVQEAVANAQKHARATLVSIGLRIDDGSRLTVTVSDDGQPKTDILPTTGIGQQTMRQRAAAIGAELKVYAHRYGHTVSLTMDLPKKT